MNARLGILLLLVASGVHAQDAGQTERASVERRVQSVQTLVESSSAAREVEKSGRADALMRRNQARQAARLARAAYDTGDLKSASALAEDATRHLIAAARFARDEPHPEEGARELAVRMDSVGALVAALRRIDEEKHASGTPQVAARIDGLLAEAKAHAAAGRVAEARPLAEQAYLLAKAAVTAMRGGDTLVRSLKFASKEDEYHYELDRNDTHRMLLGLFLKRQGREASPPTADLERSGTLRREAEARAARREHGEAIGLLEESTRLLVRTIRAAGIFIPG